LFHSEVPVLPVIEDRTLGSPILFLPPLFPLPPLAAVAAPPEASSCFSTTPPIARELGHRLEEKERGEEKERVGRAQREKEGEIELHLNAFKFEFEI
jgi:hypothetical protein